MAKSKRQTKISHIALMNWRGVGVQVLKMDDLMTAIEGPNGAGKTTFMSAFYVVLMPDLSLLKIVNVGDNEGGRESGLHGKLGTEGASYSVLDMTNPLGERFLAGIQLIPKAPPHVEVHRFFVIRNLPKHVPMEDVLVLREGQKETIPVDVHDIRQMVALHGATTEIYTKISEYGDTPYTQGLLPVNLGIARDRARFNRILQTSFQGNFSQHLQSRIKEYLLSEDTNIGGAVEQMRGNIQNNRTTRHMLERTQAFQNIVREIYHGALHLMDSTFATVRLREAAQAKELSDALKQHRHWRDTIATIEENKKNLAERLKTAKESQERLKVQKKEAEDRLEKVKVACKLTIQIEKLDKEIAEKGGLLEVAEEERRLATVQYEQALEKASTLRDQHLEVCRRLADAQTAWREISREAGLYSEAVRSLEYSQNEMSRKQLELSLENANTLLEQAKTKEEATNKEYLRLRRLLESTQQERDQFQRDLNNLNQLANCTIAPEAAFDEARNLEKSFEEIQRKVEGEGRLITELEMAQEKSHQQIRMRNALDSHPLTRLSHSSAEVFIGLYQNLRQEQEGLSEKLQETRDHHGNLQKDKEQIRHAINQARLCQGEWIRLDELCRKLEAQTEGPLRDRTRIEAAKIKASDLRDQAVGKISFLETQVKEIDSQIKDLLGCDTTPDKRLENLERALEGRLVAAQFEEADVQEAAEKQARLGPLVNAMIVEDTEKALEKISTLKDVPDEVWLVQKGKFKPEAIRARTLGDRMVVASEDVLRVTKIPEYPLLGFRARKHRSDFLRTERKRKNDQIILLKGEKETQNKILDGLGILLGKIDILVSGNPEEEITTLTEQERVLTGNVQQAESKIRDLTDALKKLKQALDIAEPWLPFAHLLNEEDYAQKAQELISQIQEIQVLKGELKRQAPLVEKLRESFKRLQSVPPSKEQLEEIQREFVTAEADFTFWRAARGNLETLIQKLPHFQFKDSFEKLQSQEDPTEGFVKQSQETERLLKKATHEEEIARQNKDDKGSKVAGLKGPLESLLEEKVKSLEELKTIGVPGTTDSLANSERDLSNSRNDLETCERELQGLETEKGTLELQSKGAQENERTAWKFRTEAIKKHRPLRIALRGVYRAANENPHLKTKILPLEEVREIYQGEEGAIAQAGEAWGALKQVAQKQPPTTQQEQERSRDSENTPAVIGEREILLNYLLRTDHAWRPTTEKETLDRHLKVWELAMDYVISILPSDIAQTEDPIAAMERMGEIIRQLSETIAQQETIFQVDAINVANAIRGRINKAHGEIRRINAILSGIQFGNIMDIKVHFETRKDLMAVLDAMSDPNQFSLLPETQIEEAMAALYKQISGGKILADEVLDYRNYVLLATKVMRKTGIRYENASSNLSTGEAIGTGAAILTVVLKAWEDHSVFSRSDLASSLRFLFIDEANRLDPDSINTLKDFCNKTQVQLLVAGPKFDASESGDGITYRMSRLTNENKEVVIVRGRSGFGLTEKERIDYAEDMGTAAVSASA